MSYSPTVGTWLEADPANYIDGSDVYQFEDARPLILKDPSGLEPFQGPRPTTSPATEPTTLPASKPSIPPHMLIRFPNDILTVKVGEMLDIKTCHVVEIDKNGNVVPDPNVQKDNLLPGMITPNGVQGVAVKFSLSATGARCVVIGLPQHNVGGHVETYGNISGGYWGRLHFFVKGINPGKASILIQEQDDPADKLYVPVIVVP